MIYSLPKEYIPFIDKPNSLMARHALAYLKARGVTREDMIKYHMGYCEDRRISKYDYYSFL